MQTIIFFLQMKCRDGAKQNTTRNIIHLNEKQVVKQLGFEIFSFLHIICNSTFERTWNALILEYTYSIYMLFL